MMRIMLLVLLAAAVGGLSAVPASACVTGFSQRALSVNLAHVRVDPFGLVTRGDRGATLLRLASGPEDESQDARCGRLLRVTPVAGPDYAIANGHGAQLGLELTADAQTGTPSSRVANARTFAVSRGESALDATVIEGLATGSGRFEGAFRIELTTADEGEVMDVAELLVTTVIQPAVSIRFDDARGPARKTLDFGGMASGDTRLFSLHVAATTAYALSVSSENGGVMTNRDAGARADAPYDLIVDGRPVPLGRTPTALTAGNAGVGGLALQTLDAAVVLGEVQAYAGRYRDTVTFTVTSVH